MPCSRYGQDMHASLSDEDTSSAFGPGRSGHNWPVRLCHHGLTGGGAGQESASTNMFVGPKKIGNRAENWHELLLAAKSTARKNARSLPGYVGHILM